MHGRITWLHRTHLTHGHLTHLRLLTTVHVHLAGRKIPHVLHTMLHAHSRLLQTLHVPIRVHSMRRILLLPALISLIISHPLHLSHLTISRSLLLSWCSMLHRCSINSRCHTIIMRTWHDTHILGHIYAHRSTHILVRVPR